MILGQILKRSEPQSAPSPWVYRFMFQCLICWAIFLCMISIFRG